VLVPVMVAVVVSGLGFPVIHELRAEWRQPGLWSIHAKITLFGTAVLLTSASRLPDLRMEQCPNHGELPASGRVSTPCSIPS
jgi:trk system potassium uptake protein TrkH